MLQANWAAQSLTKTYPMLFVSVDFMNRSFVSEMLGKPTGLYINTLCIIAFATRSSAILLIDDGGIID